MKGKLIQDKYIILKTLGRDKFSQTFLAKNKTRFGTRRYVIKKFRPILGNPHAKEIRDLFYKEATILNRLNSENPQIPLLYGFFIDGEDFYLVREWIKGITLEQKVQQQGVLPESEVKQILDSILRVLEYIHSYDIVYRQLKPSCILLRQGNWLSQLKKQDYVPVPIYFGGVKELEAKAEKIRPVRAVLAHRKEYISPEQEEGQSVYASDLYSLGLTAIYLLTGKTPDELSLDSFSNRLLWQQEAPNLKTNLARVINRAICPNVKGRFASAKEMLQALNSQPVLISRSVINPESKKSVLTPETKLVLSMLSLSLGILGIAFGLLNFGLPQFSSKKGELEDSSSTIARMDTMNQTFVDSNPKYSQNSQDFQEGLDIPTFPVGTSQAGVMDSLGNPSVISKGYWGNSKAFSYFDFAPNQIALGYLSDVKTKKIRQTEVSFDESVELKTIHTTAQRLLLDNYSTEVEHQINQIFFNTSLNRQMKLKNLKMIIQRNSHNGIYLGVWDKDFH